MKDPAFAKFVVLVNGLCRLPCSVGTPISISSGQPGQSAIHVTGFVAIIFIGLTLAVTPVRNHRLELLSHFRRMLGLYAFFYGAMHFLIYFAFQQSFSIPAVFQDTMGTDSYSSE